MGILLPWQRKSREAVETQLIPRISKGKPPRRVPRLVWLVFPVATLFLWWLFVAPSEVMWDCPGRTLLGAGEGCFVLQSEEGVEFWGLGGLQFSLDSAPLEVLAGPERCTLLSDRRITGVDFQGEAKWSVEAKPWETLLHLMENGEVLSCFPSEGGKYGETWCYRLLGEGGATRWQSALPLCPFLVVVRGERVYVGGWDLSLCCPGVLCLDQGTGHVVWARDLRPPWQGLWQGLFITGAGALLCVSEGGAQALDWDGNLLWSRPAEDPVLACALVRDTLFVADREGRVVAVGGDGEALWDRKVKSRASALVADPRKDRVLALCGNSVIAIWADNGEKAPVGKFSGQVLAYANGAFLIKTRSGLSLVRVNETLGKR